MELEEFIKNTLVSINNGISNANEELARQKGKTLGQDTSAVFVMEPHNRDKGQGYISFDVAVTVTQKGGKKGSGGIKIAVVNLSGEIDSTGSQEHVSRIKFHIIPNKYIG